MHRQSSKSLGGVAFDLNQQAGAYANARDGRPKYGELAPFGYGCFTAYDYRTPSGIYVVPANVFALRVRLVGGGGGGGAQTVTTGNGGDGGTTSFGGIVSATGGKGGEGGAVGSAAPGIGIGGDINASGGSGGSGRAAGDNLAGGGGGASGSILGDGGSGANGSSLAAGGNCCIVVVPDRVDVTVGSGTAADPSYGGYLTARHLIAPRFPFEFFSGQAFWTGGNALAYPWDGRGGSGASTGYKAPSFGGGGRGGKRDPSNYSDISGLTGGIGGGGGGCGQSPSDLGGGGGRGGDGGGFALKYVNVNPGDEIAFSVGAGGTQGTGVQSGGPGGSGLLVIEY